MCRLVCTDLSCSDGPPFRLHILLHHMYTGSTPSLVAGLHPPSQPLHYDQRPLIRLTKGRGQPTMKWKLLPFVCHLELPAMPCQMQDMTRSREHCE